MGIRQRRVSALAWVGRRRARRGRGDVPTRLPGTGRHAPAHAIALAAFPAAILGGLDSTAGALVGGLIIGIAEATPPGTEDQLLFLGRSRRWRRVHRDDRWCCWSAVRAVRDEGSSPVSEHTAAAAGPPRQRLRRRPAPVRTLRGRASLVVLLALPLYIGVLAPDRVYRDLRRDRGRDRAQPAGRPGRPAVARARVLPRRRCQRLRLPRRGAGGLGRDLDGLGCRRSSR